jgi:Flp pilus assembly protein TadG
MKTSRAIPRSSRAGQAVAELALLLPLVVLFLLITVDLGRLFYAFQSVESAAAAGAQYGSQSYAVSGLTASIQSNALVQATDLITNNIPVAITSFGTVSNISVTCTITNKTFLPWQTVMHWFLTNYPTSSPYDIRISRTVNMRILKPL